MAAIRDSNDIRMERVEHAGLEEEGWLGGGIWAHMSSICEVGGGEEGLSGHSALWTTVLLSPLVTPARHVTSPFKSCSKVRDYV